MKKLLDELRPRLLGVFAFSFFMNMLLVVPAIFTLQVFDRVTVSRSSCATFDDVSISWKTPRYAVWRVVRPLSRSRRRTIASPSRTGSSGASHAWRSFCREPASAFSQ